MMHGDDPPSGIVHRAPRISVVGPRVVDDSADDWSLGARPGVRLFHLSDFSGRHVPSIVKAGVRIADGDDFPTDSERTG